MAFLKRHKYVKTVIDEKVAADEAVRHMKFDKTLKILLLGDSFVGKTCLMHKFVDRNFDTSRVSITVNLVEFMNTAICVQQNLLRLVLWDTLGQEKTRSLTLQFYRGTHGILLLYDVTSRASFRSLGDWLKIIASAVGNTCDVLLVGNKVDDSGHRDVSIDEANAFAKRHCLPYIETSAKCYRNVEEAFYNLVVQVLKRQQLTQELRTTSLPDQRQSFHLAAANSDSGSLHKTRCCPS